MSSRYWSVEDCCWIEYERPAQAAVVPAPTAPVEAKTPAPAET